MKTDSQLQSDVLEELRHDAAVATNDIGEPAVGGDEVHRRSDHCRGKLKCRAGGTLAARMRI